MGRGGASAEAFTVGRLLNEAQRSAAGHKKCAAALWRLVAKDVVAVTQQLCACLRHILPIAQRDLHVERVVRFIGHATACPPEGLETEASDLVEQLLGFLLGVTSATDKAVRYRACQLMAQIFNSLEMEVSEELLEAVEEAMLQRLRDKAPNVRMTAATVLARLASPDEDGSFAEDNITAALLAVLQSDSNKEVRKSVVGALVVDAETTLPAIIARTRDVDPDVRRMTYEMLLEKAPLESISPAQRSQILREGLSDRHPRVAQSAQRLLAGWLRAVENDLPALLSLLDVQANEATAETVLKLLFAQRGADPVEMAHAAVETKSGLRAEGAATALLPPEEALLWRVTCEWLAREGEERGKAAAASSGAAANLERAAAEDSIEALEAALPATVGRLLQVTEAHAAAGPQHAFATRQLLHLAARCTDLTDAAGRTAASNILAKLLRQPAAWVASTEAPSESTNTDDLAFGGGAWAAALAELAGKVYSDESELAAALLMAIKDVCAGWASEEAGPSESMWLHALGVAAVLLGGLTSSSPSSFQTLLDGGSEEAGSRTTLAVMDLPQELLLPAVGSDIAVVRREALRCVGLYCLLDAGSSGGSERALAAPLDLLRTGLAVDEPGVRWVDVLLPPAADGDAANASHRPLVDLLLVALDNSLAHNDSGEGYDNERAALGAAAAEGLAKLLVAGAAAAEAGSGPNDSEYVKVLARLLALMFDPATAEQTRLRQALSVALEAYAGLGPVATRTLAAAFLPAARRGLALGVKQKQAPLLLRFMGQLLQVKQTSGDAGEDRGLESLALAICQEALSCPMSVGAKPYVAALCKVLAALPLRPAAPQLPALAALAKQLESHFVRDRAAAKDAATFSTCVAKASAAGSSGEAAAAMDADELAALLEATSMQRGDAELLEAWPLPFEAVGAPTPARTRRTVAVASSDSDDEEEATPPARPPPRRSMPTRSARKPSYAKRAPPPSDDDSSSDAKDSAHGNSGCAAAAAAAVPRQREARQSEAAEHATDADSGSSGEDTDECDSDAESQPAAAETPAAARQQRRQNLSPGGRRKLPTPASPAAPAAGSSDESSDGDESEVEASDEENEAPTAAAKAGGGRKVADGKAAASRVSRQALRDNVAV